jgi:hypothetical protein
VTPKTRNRFRGLFRTGWSGYFLGLADNRYQTSYGTVIR